MFLAADVGNTTSVYGVFQGDSLVAHWRVTTDRSKTADELGLTLSLLLQTRGITPADIDGMAVASVVPPVLPNIVQMADTYLGITPLVVGPGVKTGIPLRFENPREIGADRICNAVAAVRKCGGPAIVVDFGTSTNFDAISEAGEYLGGAIAPGIAVSMEALFGKASRLPQIDLMRPKSAIGKSTVDSIRSGTFYGVFGQVKEIVTRMRAEIKGTPTVIATGSFSELFATEMDIIECVDEFLTLDGLRLIYEHNAQ